MQKPFTLLFATLLLGAFLFTGCKKDSTDTPGGDPTPIGTVGNQFTGYLVGLSNFNAVVTSNSGGIANIGISGTITDQSIKDIAPLLNSSSMATIDPVTGDFSVDLKVKFTTEGVADYYATDGKASTVVNYDAKVGDTYKCKSAEGESFTRTVTARSDTDDYYYGFLLIKTITIEEPISNPAVTKLVYRANHRFGIVNITAVLQDGTEVGITLFSTNEN
jgi:hypothetical protein